MEKTTNYRTIKELVAEDLQNLHLNELAAKLIDGLAKLETKYEDSAQRWIWELIQNAKDASVGLAPVEIEIEIGEDYVDFRHSGKPFTYRDLNQLINQTSCKERGDST